MTRTEEIRERCEKTTRGKWKLEKCEHGAAIYTVPTNSTFGIKHNIALEGAEATDEDMIFIAHAREDVPWLLAELERVKAERDAEQLANDALNDALKKQSDLLAEARRERDGAIRDLRYISIEASMECACCCHKHTAQGECDGCRYGSHWRWRGIQAATGAEEGGEGQDD